MIRAIVYLPLWIVGAVLIVLSLLLLRLANPIVGVCVGALDERDHADGAFLKAFFVKWQAWTKIHFWH